MVLRTIITLKAAQIVLRKTKKIGGKTMVFETKRRKRKEKDVFKKLGKAYAKANKITGKPKKFKGMEKVFK